MGDEAKKTNGGAASAAPKARPGNVRMVRPQPDHPGGPTTADVHPAEVEAWNLGGWSVAEKQG